MHLMLAHLNESRNKRNDNKIFVTFYTINKCNMTGIIYARDYNNGWAQSDGYNSITKLS